MSALSRTIEWFQSETFGRTEELESLKREIRNRVTVDQHNTTKASYRALQALDHLVWNFVRFDDSLLSCRRQWTVAKVLLMSAGIWQSFENRISYGHRRLRQSTRDLGEAWGTASIVSKAAFDQAMEMSLKVSSLRDSFATQRDYLNTAIEEWENTFSQAHERLAKLNESMTATTRELKIAKGKLDDAELYKQISDIKHAFIQGVSQNSLLNDDES